jgi:Poly(ADP-ribose) polymerase catalytic domain
VSCFDSTIGNPDFKVHNVEALFNRDVSNSFMMQFDKVQKRNPAKSVKDIIKFLFIGTKAKDPRAEARKDNLASFKVKGLYGTGVYFSELASMVKADAFPNANANPRTILLCAVLVGDYCSLAPQELPSPPDRPAGNPFDSVSNQANTQWIVYETTQFYPLFLITYN